MNKKWCKKASFSNESQAKFFIEKLIKTSTRVKTPKRAYLCDKCNNWHLTSIPDKDREYELSLEIKIIELKEELNTLQNALQKKNEKIRQLNKESEFLKQWK